MRGAETALYVKILRTVKNFQAEILDHAISHTAEISPFARIIRGGALSAKILRTEILGVAIFNTAIFGA